MAREEYLFTSESVTEGHPDKIADQISDAVLDAILAQDPTGRVACETLLTTGLVVVAGEITTSCYVDIPKVARETIREVGYTRAKFFSFDAASFSASDGFVLSSPPAGLQEYGLTWSGVDPDVIYGVGAHSIWALVLHMTAWHGEVRRRLAGATPAMPAEGDWPEPPPASPEAWRHAVQALSSSLEEVCEAIAALSEADLDRRIGTLERPLGTGVTLREMLVGLLQHDTYHSGQIALLKKAI